MKIDWIAADSSAECYTKHLVKKVSKEQENLGHAFIEQRRMIEFLKGEISRIMHNLNCPEVLEEEVPLAVQDLQYLLSQAKELRGGNDEQDSRYQNSSE